MSDFEPSHQRSADGIPMCQEIRPLNPGDAVMGNSASSELLRPSVISVFSSWGLLKDEMQILPQSIQSSA